jgi:hypothetical protein
MKNQKQRKLYSEVLIVSKKDNKNKKQPMQADTERRAGYGDKKLEGPDRPST